MLLFTNENHTGSLRSEINALQHASFLETLTGTRDQRSSDDNCRYLHAKIIKILQSVSFLKKKMWKEQNMRPLTQLRSCIRCICTVTLKERNYLYYYIYYNIYNNIIIYQLENDTSLNGK